MEKQVVKKAWKKSCGTALVLLAGATVQAETTTAAQQQRTHELQTVVVAGQRAASIAKTGVPPAEQPRAISIVDRELLDQRVVLEISDALRTVSGFGQVGNYAQFRPSYVLRGFSLTRVFEDGFNVSTTNRTSELAGTERIEVLKGPAGALYGNINPGGILNLVSKLPTRESVNTVQLTATSEDLYRYLADIGGRLDTAGDVLGRTVLVYENGDSFRDYVDRESVFANSSLSWAIDDATSLDVVARYQKARGTHDQGIPTSRSLLHLPPERLLNEPTDKSRYENAALRAWLTHRLNDDWNLRAGLNASMARYDNIYKTFQLPANSDLGIVGTGVRRAPHHEQGTATEYIAQVDLTGAFATGALGHRFAVGIEIGQDNNRSSGYVDTRYFSTIDYLNPVYLNPQPESTLTNYNDDRSNGVALYLQDQIAVTDWLEVTLGGRFDSVRTRRDVENTDVRTRRNSDNFAPFAGIVVKPLQNLMLFANYSESFTTQIGTQLQNSAMPDPNIGSQHEIGLKSEWFEQRLAATLSAFKIRQENILVAVPGQSYSIQSGEQRSEGVEFELNGQVWQGWSVALAYTYLDAYVHEDLRLPVGAGLVNAARNSFSLWNHYEFTGSLQGFSAGFGVFHLGHRAGNLLATSATNPGGNTVTLPGYTRFDAALGYAQGPWRTDLYLENLGNKHYLHARGPVLHPGAPFNARLALAYQF